MMVKVANVAWRRCGGAIFPYVPMAKAFVTNPVEVDCPPLVEGVCIFEEIALFRSVNMRLFIVMALSTGERWVFLN